MIQEGEESFRLPVHHPVPSKRQSSKAAEPKLRGGHARMRRFAPARSAWMFFLGPAARGHTERALSEVHVEPVVIEDHVVSFTGCAAVRARQSDRPPARPQVGGHLLS